MYHGGNARRVRGRIWPKDVSVSSAARGVISAIAWTGSARRVRWLWLEDGRTGAWIRQVAAMASTSTGTSTCAGAGLAATLTKYSAELAQLLAADHTLRDQAAELLAALESAVSQARALDAELVGRA